ncbi:MAG: hypothetical protein E3K37_02965 [Candidatus Kuenenia sp.]|nr:hypothetical protein [Candidatus Kuenenia hertensis]
MARQARIEFEGAFYHVMNRGNHRENIFLDTHDREKFYEIVGNIESRYGIIVYVFVLMSNHYHILLETPHANLSRAIQRLNGDYALYFSRRHKRPGHLFQGRYKAMLVEKETYLLELSRYIHLNPFRAGLARNPEEYKWSSLPAYATGKAHFPFTLHWEWIASRFGKKKDSATGKYLEFIREGIRDGSNPGLKAAGKWILGSDDWIKTVLKRWGNFSSRELSGVKPLRKHILVETLEEHVCNEFEIKRETLEMPMYNNVARQAMMFLAVNHGGMTLKEVSQRYGARSYYSVSKAVSRFRQRVAKDHTLHKRFRKILSNVQM